MFGMTQADIETIHHCFDNYPGIDLVVIYGSRAKGNYQHGSDIDLMIDGDMTFRQLMLLDSELDDLMLPYEIDLSLKSRINNQDLIAHIEQVGKVFYDRTHRMVLSDPPVEYLTIIKARESL